METENQGEPTTLYMETAVKMVHVCVRVRRQQKSMHVYTDLSGNKSSIIYMILPRNTRLSLRL